MLVAHGTKREANSRLTPANPFEQASLTLGHQCGLVRTNDQLLRFVLHFYPWETRSGFDNGSGRRLALSLPTEGALD